MPSQDEGPIEEVDGANASWKRGRGPQDQKDSSVGSPDNIKKLAINESQQVIFLQDVFDEMHGFQDALWNIQLSFQTLFKDIQTLGSRSGKNLTNLRRV